MKRGEAYVLAANATQHLMFSSIFDGENTACLTTSHMQHSSMYMAKAREDM